MKCKYEGMCMGNHCPCVLAEDIFDIVIKSDAVVVDIIENIEHVKEDNTSLKIGRMITITKGNVGK